MGGSQGLEGVNGDVGATEGFFLPSLNQADGNGNISGMIGPEIVFVSGSLSLFFDRDGGV